MYVTAKHVLNNKDRKFQCDHFMLKLLSFNILHFIIKHLKYILNNNFKNKFLTVLYTHVQHVQCAHSQHI